MSIVQLIVCALVFGLCGYFLGQFDMRQKKDDGIITVDLTGEDKIVCGIAYNGDPYDMQDRDTVTFKIETIN